jgi:hypothetical protein
MPAHLIHPVAINNYSDVYLKEVHELFGKAVLHTGTNQEIKEAIAEFIFRFAVLMPYSRGSAAIGEWLLQALCSIHSLPHPQKQGFSYVDQLAQSSFGFKEFWNIFKLFWFEPIILEGHPPLGSHFSPSSDRDGAAR